MLDRPIVTLLTDFGLQDGYAGVMKGVIASIAPHARAIDITHQIPPQNLIAARFCLMSSYAYFPRGTIHLAVVDPGVGSQQRGVAIRFAEGYLVGPDNGLFSGVLSLSEAISAVSLTNPEYWRVPSPSSTFHGRDIFAPIAGHLADGVPLEVLGDSIDPDSLVRLPIEPLEIHGDRVLGSIQYIDIFGNLITDIPSVVVTGKNWSIEFPERTIPARSTYSDVPEGAIVPLIGSHGYLEISVNRGNAREALQLDWGDRIAVKLE
ncbi:SAM-dependent chlorinase/fluorinase [Pannus brasiliensis CCIBt3594]|uniref:SAM-dependent chlorinase/fluorinase n=1 Tax=Pannus brasiliensis CCIBt3594 TaxID=1427578 RepID=A0AAW9QFL0_9CHRO